MGVFFEKKFSIKSPLGFAVLLITSLVAVFFASSQESVQLVKDYVTWKASVLSISIWGATVALFMVIDFFIVLWAVKPKHLRIHAAYKETWITLATTLLIMAIGFQLRLLQPFFKGGPGVKLVFSFDLLRTGMLIIASSFTLIGGVYKLTTPILSKLDYGSVHNALKQFLDLWAKYRVEICKIYQTDQAKRPLTFLSDSSWLEKLCLPINNALAEAQKIQDTEYSREDLDHLIQELNVLKRFIDQEVQNHSTFLALELICETKETRIQAPEHGFNAFAFIKEVMAA